MISLLFLYKLYTAFHWHILKDTIYIDFSPLFRLWISVIMHNWGISCDGLCFNIMIQQCV